MKTPGVKVSVILPVYNVEPYLDECLMSIIKQTMTDIEIICINDGSTDGSANLLKKYAEKDSRIIIVNQQNAGAGAARNNGMRFARGEYLSFLDADDFFELTMLEEAYHRCKKFDADFVVFRSNAYISDPPRFKPTLWTIKDDLLPDKKVFNYKDIKKDIFKVFNGWAWDKLYKRNFIVSNNLYFQEQRSTNDLLFVFSALVSAKRITVLQNTLAHHRTNLSDSISVTREKSWECFYFALLALKDKLEAMGIFEEVKQSYINYALNFSLWNLDTIKGIAYEKLYNRLREEYFKTLGISDFPKDYFYNQGEYERYIRIKEEPMVVYLLNEIAVYKDRLGNMIEKRRHFDQHSYKIGRIITFFPRMIFKFFKALRKRGIKYTMQIILNRLRRTTKAHV